MYNTGFDLSQLSFMSDRPTMKLAVNGQTKYSLSFMMMLCHTDKKDKLLLIFLHGCGRRVRVSGGHLCAMHRSADRGGSRDLEPLRAALPLARLRCPKFITAWGAYEF